MTKTTPKRDAYLAAKAAAEASWESEADTVEQSEALDAAAEVAKAEFLASGEPHLYELRDDSGPSDDLVSAQSMADALEEAESWVRGGDWLMDGEGTAYVTARIRDLATDEEDSVTVTIEPDEPACVDGEAHDWQAPHALVGGIKENPGVWGHGGGVKIREVCLRCGCGKLTDTWAQNPSTGEQGLTSVKYTAGQYADDVCGASC